MRILLGWELGAGQGHLQFLAALGQQLHQAGAECVFALKYFNLKQASFPGTVLAAPRLPFLGREMSYSYADILETFGFANLPLLQSHLQAWEALLQAVQPDLVVADSAPGLVLATHNRIPTVVVGSPFLVPPPVEEFPILRFPAPPESFQHQQQVGYVIRQAVSLDVSLGVALNADSSFIYSIPELDPYRHLRCFDPQIDPYGPYVGVPDAPIPQQLHQPTGEVWAYLADDHPNRDLVLNTLRPRSDFQPITEMGNGKALFIHSAGTLTSVTCLLAGIPQLLLPTNLEQLLSATALEGLGVGKILIKPRWEGLLLAQAQAYALTDQAQQQAQQLAYWNQNFMNRIVNACLNQLAGDAT